ncbi:MAG: futalosine hydrolase [Marinilabiliales bacterium]|nr:MAG: futalosine hydrolase [Marinilabiliales bacterium]
MKILVVSATEKEILPIKKHFRTKNTEVCVMKYSVIKSLSVDFLITGIGGVLTTYALTRTLSEMKYDWVINAGIAGSFNNDLEIGETVWVRNDQLADVGIEDKDKFYTMFEKGFGDQDEFPFKNGMLENTNTLNLNLKEASAITVNRTHGNKTSINLFRDKFKADIETMEGAAFFYVCLQEGVKFMQIRSISNYVKERDEANWNITLAIKNLNTKLLEIIDVISK